MTTRQKKTTRFFAAIATSAVLLAGCGGSSDASPEDYDKVRESLSQTLAASTGVQGATYDITDSEIDCIAGQLDVSVKDLSDPKTGSNDPDADTKIYRCMTGDTIRQLISGLYSQEPAASQIAASGADTDCIVDKIVETFDEWKAGTEPYSAFVSKMTTETATQVQACV